MAKQYLSGTSKLGGPRLQESDVGWAEIQSIVRTNIQLNNQPCFVEIIEWMSVKNLTTILFPSPLSGEGKG
jgi:hypothetical protein